MQDKSNRTKPIGQWEYNTVVGQSYIRLFFGVILTVYSYLGHTYHWVGAPPLSLFYLSLSYITFVSVFLPVAGLTDSNRWQYALFSLVIDVMFATASMMLGGISTAYLYGIFLWITIGYGIRFGRNIMLIANVLCIVGFLLVITNTDFWIEHAFIGWGLMLWIVLMPIYIGKMLNKLETAVKAADRANTAKSQFLANMSHEIRTPLTAIIGHSDEALDRNQTTEQHLSALHTIHYSSIHLLNLLNNILDFSKIDAGEVEIECFEMNPVQTISAVESIVMNQAKEKGLKFTVNYTAPIPKSIVSDPIRLKQILLNLCSNAIKFTERGSVEIQISFVTDSDSLVIRVTDTGIGMTEEQCQKVFKPFKQADSSTTRKFGGTGLGLSLSKQLAELLNCSLSVESEFHKGTCFTLSVPRGNVNDRGMLTDGNMLQNNQIIPAKNREVTQQNNNQFTELYGRVLLVEDTEINQQLIARFLSGMGASVAVADNGQQAVEQALGQEFDLIYMDMQMPVMSGIEAIKILRDKGYKQPIVVLTANATNEDERQCKEAGADGFLTKPINRSSLYDMTARYLAQRRQQKSI